MDSSQAPIAWLRISTDFVAVVHGLDGWPGILKDRFAREAQSVCIVTCHTMPTRQHPLNESLKQLSGHEDLSTEVSQLCTQL
jgi:hypothetical protein